VSIGIPLQDYMGQFIQGVFNPDCAIGIYCGEENAAATLVSRFCSFNVFMNTARSQNRSNFASRKRFLRLVTIPTAQSGFNYAFIIVSRQEQGNEWMLTRVGSSVAVVVEIRHHQIRMGMAKLLHRTCLENGFAVQTWPQ